MYICIVNDRIQILRGIHPGKLIENDLKKNHISQETIARQVGVSKQMINAIIAGRRDISIELSLKLDHALNYEEGSLAQLQTWYKIEEIKTKQSLSLFSSPPNVRQVLFWDYDYDKLDWGRYRNAIIHRVLERGSREEKAEIARYYDIPIEQLENYRLPEIYYQPKNMKTNEKRDCKVDTRRS